MKNKALAAVLAAGTFWGTMGFFARSLYAAGFGPLEVAQTRITTGLVFVGLYIFLFNRSLFKVKLKDIWCFLGTGIVSLLLFSTCYFSALNYTSLAVAAILLYTVPFFVMLLSLLLFKEKMNGKKVFALLLAFTGCVLVSGVGGDTADQVEANCKLFDQTVKLSAEQMDKLHDAFRGIDPRVINPGMWYNKMK